MLTTVIVTGSLTASEVISGDLICFWFEGTEIHLPILMVNYLFYFAFDLDNYILERCHFVVSAHSTGQKNVTFRVWSEQLHYFDHLPILINELSYLAFDQENYISLHYHFRVRF